MFCIKCNQQKNKDEMYYSNHRNMFENVCLKCKRDAMTLYQIERAETEDKKTILHLRNVIRKMIESLEDRNSKQLRLWADVGRMEIGGHKIGKRWGSDVYNK